jgi:nitrite reductase (NADH) small subunit
MRICSVAEILNNSGVCALVGGEQVAVFRVDQQVYAIGNRDPFSGANVLSRGIVGDIGGELVVASPVYKQHFSLSTGRCIEDASVSVPVYRVLVDGADVQIFQLGETQCPI